MGRHSGSLRSHQRLLPTVFIPLIPDWLQLRGSFQGAAHLETISVPTHTHKHYLKQHTNTPRHNDQLCLLQGTITLPRDVTYGEKTKEAQILNLVGHHLVKERKPHQFNVIKRRKTKAVLTS